MRILLVGDMHVRNVQHHADDFEDRRVPERQEIEDEIANVAKTCDLVIQAGDFLDSRDASPEEIRKAVAFLESLGDKTVRILSGNHGSSASGRTAEDFINELSGMDWKAVNEICVENGICYVPYMRKQQFGVQTDTEVVHKVLEKMDELLASEGAKEFEAIVIHHAIGGTYTVSGQLTDLFHEPVFGEEALLTRAKFVFGAHIHKPQGYERLHVIGSVMNHDYNEGDQKRVIVYDTGTHTAQSVPLPGRRFCTLKEPTVEEVMNARSVYDLVKVVTSDEEAVYKWSMDKGVIIQEAPKAERRKETADLADFSVKALLPVYAKERSVDYDALSRAYSKIE